MIELAGRRRTPIRILAVVCAVAGALSIAGAAEADPLFGFNENGFQYYETGTHSAEQIARLEARAGAKTQRFVISWARVQAEPGPNGNALRSNWGLYDRAIAAMRAEGIRPLITIEDAPAWATSVLDCGGRTCPPTNNHLDDWYRFSRDVANRYPDAAAIEVWSEPNWAGRWTTHDGPDPARYATLFETAARAIHTARPQMRVLIGGVTYWHRRDVSGGNLTIPTFLREFYDSVDKSRLEPQDGLSLHVYPWIDEFDSLHTQFATTLRQVRDVRNAEDPTRRLWITETGITTSVPYGTTAVGESDQSRGLLNIIDATKKMSDVAAVIIHTLIEPPPSYREPSEQGFGVLRADLTPKKAFCDLVRRAGNPAPAGCAADPPPSDPGGTGTGTGGTGVDTGGIGTGTGGTGSGTGGSGSGGGVAPACTVTGTPGNDVLVGGAGPDVICARGGWDVVLARGGNDTVIGARGADRLRGGGGDDTLVGGRGPDRLRGGLGTDLLKGGRGRDTKRQ